ncbi:hypothetical protein EDC65_2655 [Stella humosa]|uniref:Elongation factor P hydroxylase n=1 Tax=Stella humosa TaxID=94 RepID=A0A3N1LK40_9PROT|nr:hypothetical protein [Stella humosa]ROP90796.1 hypothetical protein EDC65_2655 [Stella humosa]BBK34858.1 hypothetical protein STHU_54920 [Stella humosa]
MILTTFDAAALPAALAGFAERLMDQGPAGRTAAARAFARIAASGRHGGPEDTAARRAQAVAFARSLGIPTLAEAPADAFSWDGSVLRTDSEAWVILHEVAHWLLAPPWRRGLRDFGLGAGPETGRKPEADQDRRLDETALAAEEAEASLLGILLEAALDQPALHAFLEQNWLEGWQRPSTADYFAAVVGRLLAQGMIDADGWPTAAPRRTSHRAA